MTKWFEEVRLGSRPLEEIGAAFYIREMLGNGCLVNKWDVKAVFGDGYADILERLRSAGMLKVEAVGSQLRLAIVAPGDKKRKRCRKLVQTNRAVKKFEKSIMQGATPSHSKKRAAPSMARHMTGEVRPSGLQEASFI